MLHIDSSVRDIQLFPNQTDFQVAVNVKPSENDVRYQSKLMTRLAYHFQWVGNSNGNNPISKIKNDTFLTKIIPISSKECIIVPGNERVEKLIHQPNYFVHVKVWFDYSNKFSTVIAYDYETGIATMNSDIFQYYFENINYKDVKEKTLTEFYRNAYFINTSKHFGSNIILLGVGNVNLSSGYGIENVTKRWKTKLVREESQDFYFLEKNLEYDLLDIFVIYRLPYKVERLLSLEFTNEIVEMTDEVYGFRTNDYIGYIGNTSNYVCIISILEHTIQFLPIKEVDNDIVYLSYNLSELPNFDKNHYIIAILPYESIFPTLLIDRNFYRNNISLSIESVTIPNKILKNIHSDRNLEQIPYITLKINKELIMTNIVSNIPHMESSFICYTNNDMKNDFIVFKSMQKIRLKEIFRHSIDISILLPNNQVITFQDDDWEKTVDGRKILLHDINNTISITFQLYR